MSDKTKKPSAGSEANPRTISNDDIDSLDFFVDDALSGESILFKEGFTTFFQILESDDGGKNWNHSGVENTKNKAEKHARRLDDDYRSRWVKRETRRWEAEHAPSSKEKHRFETTISARTPDSELEAITKMMQEEREKLRKSSEKMPEFKKKDATNVPLIKVEQITVMIQRAMP